MSISLYTLIFNEYDLLVIQLIFIELNSLFDSIVIVVFLKWKGEYMITLLFKLTFSMMMAIFYLPIILLKYIGKILLWLFIGIVFIFIGF